MDESKHSRTAPLGARSDQAGDAPCGKAGLSHSPRHLSRRPPTTRSAMASYTDNRNALFASKSDGKAPPAEKKKATQKAPLSLGGPSAAAVAKKKEQEAALRSKGDALFAEAEALMPPKKTGFAGLMAKKPNPLFAAPKYAAAAAAYASAKARPLALSLIHI